MLHVNECILVLLLGLATTASSIKCDRKIDGVTTQASQLEGKFWITLASNNRTEIIDQYMPNVKYIVTIEGRKISDAGPAGVMKFTKFLLTAENKNDSLSAGSFDLGDDLLTQFSDKCSSAVSERTSIAKTDVSVFWTSPPEGSGCVMIRATVMENEESWYMDEGGLVRTICQNPKAIEDDPGIILNDCHACDEAKYEVSFEGLWSRNTHPKDFPSKGWLIRFSDVIGASHSFDYSFWNYGELASEGLKQVAEFGSTRKLESELKEKSENIRTIIKARGITYPNVTGRTFAVFRVDQKHHLVSLVSMIVPSPDWIVGVSKLELCQEDGTWIERKELNLYPIDVGTDDGITYTSPDSPSNPPDVIKAITTSYPNDSRSPFYDPTGHDMKPMAKLHLTRQRLYEKTCEEVQSSAIDPGVEDDRPKPHKACKTTPWGPWSNCSSTCSQLRQRFFRNPSAAAAHNCTNLLTDRRPCEVTDPPCTGGNSTLLDSPECELSEWSPWSGCTAECGQVPETRTRNFIYKKFRKYCRAEKGAPELQQTHFCELPPCPDADFEKSDSDEEEYGEGDDDEEPNDEAEFPEEPVALGVTEEWLQKCPVENYSPWSYWSPCKSPCGGGEYSRIRYPIGGYEGPEECKTQVNNCTAKIVSCNITKKDAFEICNEPRISGDCDRVWKRWYYDPKTERCHSFDYYGCKGNRNNFETIEDCRKICINFQGEDEKSPPKNYKVSISSVLSYHIPQDQRSTKTKRAQWNEDGNLFNGIQSSNQVGQAPKARDDNKKVNCRFTDWSEWSRCNGCRGYTFRTRKILIPAKNGGTKCPTKLIRKKRCRKILNCGNNITADISRRRRRYRDRKSVANHNEVSADCELSEWSAWSRCNASCGESVQHRTKKSKFQRHDSHGKPCTKLVEFRKCSTFPCL